MRNLCVFFLFFFFSFSIYSQSPYPAEPVAEDPFYLYESAPKSPEAGNLGMYGDVTNNPYTGKANISIPLHAINLDGLQIPIQLSYNSGGVRVSQEASWVGLNWNLSSNYGISRQVMGVDDLINDVIGVADGRSTEVGYVYNDYDVTTGPYNNPIMDLQDVRDIHYSFVPNGGPAYKVDTQPDIFDLSLFGKSYKFRFEKKQIGSNIIDTYIYNDRNAVITYNSSPGNESFTLVDDQGFTYLFKTKDYSTSWSSPEPEANTFEIFFEMIYDDLNKIDETLVTTWHLDRITSPYGNEVNITYTKGTHLTVPGYSTFYQLQGDSPLSSDKRIVGGGEKFSNSFSIITSNYISKIEGDFGEILFNLEDREDLLTGNGLLNYMEEYGPSSNYTFGLLTSQGTVNQCHGTTPCSGITDKPKRLGGITIRDYNQNNVSTIDFDYSYFRSDKSNAPDKHWYLRLKLDKITVIDKEFKFTYENPNGLPVKNSFAVDFWGFYNGKTSNIHLTPSIGRFINDKVFGSGVVDLGETFFEYNGADRSSDFNYGKIGSLTKIDYPTGGYTLLEYEAHNVVLNSPNQYVVTDEFLNGRIKETNLRDELDYKFTYQYLKRMKTPSFSFYDHKWVSSGQTGNGVKVVVDEIIEVQTPSQLIFDGSLRLEYYGCNMPYFESSPARFIEDPDTHQNVNTFLFYRDWEVPSGCPNPTIQSTQTDAFRTIPLPPGTYRIKKFFPERIEIGGQYIEPPAIWIENEHDAISSPYTIYEESGLPGNLPLIEAFEIGGTRVKSLTNYSNDGLFISKKMYNYDYFNISDPTLASSGKLMDDLLFFSKAYGFHSYNPRGYASSRLKYTSSSSIMGNPSAEGSHIGYSNTTELTLNSNDDVLSAIERTFHNQKNTYFYDNVLNWYSSWCVANTYNDRDVSVQNTVILGMAPEQSYDYLNGKVLSESHFDSAGNELLRSNYLYTTLNANEDETYFSTFMGLPTQNALVLPTCRPEFYGPYLGDDHTYRVYQAPSYYGRNAMLNTKETFTYFDNGELITVERFNYDYDTHHLIAKESEIAENDIVFDQYFYPYSSEVYNESGMSSLRSNNQLNTIVKTKKYRNNNKLSERLLGFSTFGNNTMVSKVSEGKGNQVVLTEKTFYERYSDEGKLLQTRRKDGIPVSYIWGYNQQHVIAKVINATYAQIEALQYFGQGFEIQEGLSTNQETQLRGMQSAQVMTYEYAPGIGVTQMTNQRDDKNLFEYNPENRLKYIKDRNSFITDEFKYHINPNLITRQAAQIDTSDVFVNLQLKSVGNYLSQNRNYDGSGNLKLTGAIRLETLPNYLGNTTLNYKVLADGGSGNYEYRWRFKAEEYDPNDYLTSDSWSYSLDCLAVSDSSLHVYCEITDTFTNETIEVKLTHPIYCN